MADNSTVPQSIQTLEVTVKDTSGQLRQFLTSLNARVVALETQMATLQKNKTS